MVDGKLEWDAAIRQTERQFAIGGLLRQVIGDDAIRVDAPFFVKAKTAGQVIERRGYALGKVYLLRRRTHRKGE